MPFLSYDPKAPKGKPNITGLHLEKPSTRNKHIEVSQPVFQKVSDQYRCYAVEDGKVVQVRSIDDMIKQAAVRKNMATALRNLDTESTNPIAFKGKTLHVDNGLLLRINVNLLSGNDSIEVPALELTDAGLKPIKLSSEEVKELAFAIVKRDEQLINKYGNM